jgi:hypothetical protein
MCLAIGIIIMAIMRLIIIILFHPTHHNPQYRPQGKGTATAQKEKVDKRI